MYGIVNKAIEDLVRETFGEDKWEAIKKRSGVDIDFFLSNEPYDDSVTYKLAQAAADETGLTLDAVLTAFGEWWVLRTSREKYGALLQAGGASMTAFLRNLPVFHNRIMLIYPKLTPPEFRVSNETETSIDLHYLSAREGLQSFVRGLLIGIGKLYEMEVSVDLLQSRPAGDSHEVFRVSWEKV
ncbi:MAG TPA: heme NO-binding domain-containing protein [Cyclobacteriaceae bacterium]|nr:heme NO-binding domain-containing protein [Cyclobacteriaceae bacterium]HMV10986.1 heme NO-binding domain-containing protein [Cyclobacteriaceae bacterium]HMV91037.1 heme NO-binding domain-containing protein [Cyclobacteriaceae bacterium]HMX01849.1 heme NO-binding domain-containing protein [Cyclobacteriaceae bacterium]HMX50773.1 heme NO-binding domain-containing protein [Cyclobacteriaceae bacterium]